MRSQQVNSSSKPQNSNLCTPTKSSDNSISKVRVIVRVRPFLPHECCTSNCVSIVSLPLQSASEVTLQLKDPHSNRSENYKVDSYYGEEDEHTNVRQIFDRELMPLIPAVVNGSNATVFAYGATGSGKTFTMQGSNEVPGLMPMAISTILSMCETVEISFYEIYMEKCYDLLKKRKEIAILDDKDGNPHLIGLTKIPIRSMLDFQDLQNVNDVSSRGHSVVVISVTNGGKLNLIDLAGNESQSLFALSQVIHAINNNNNSTRIPYRDSKLTRVLQDSLGGTSHTLMVACLNPGEYEHSVHTVSLAARSRRIVQSAQKHHTPKFQGDMDKKLQVWLESKGKKKSTFKKISGKPKPVHTSEQHAHKVERSITRNVLSPINFKNPITPKQQFVENTNTPLTKFKEMSCNLKSTLAQEYINFLNTASKEELLQLKGVEKR